jgi:acyl-CoA reductase-like NAD-dependent aldehyde dehydrogenase
LLGAPVAAALVTGNTVVMKPSSETPLSAVLMTEIFIEAGLPAGTVNCLTGSGRVVGDGLARHPDVDGITFTGSLDVGFNQIYRQFSTRFPKPSIVEMGGKNPAIVMASADLDRAALGIHRSAFGMNGHKCSACSRLYVHEAVADDLLARLERKLAETKIGDPLRKETFLGPIATRAGYEDYQRFVAMAGRGHRGATRCGSAGGPHRRRARARLLRRAHAAGRPAARPSADARRALRADPGGGAREGPGRGAGPRPTTPPSA